MRSVSSARRSRQRGRKSTSDNVYESNGPDVKIRGSARHIAGRYQVLSRDAMSAGDYVLSESFMQYAEHYTRLCSDGVGLPSAISKDSLAFGGSKENDIIENEPFSDDEVSGTSNEVNRQVAMTHSSVINQDVKVAGEDNQKSDTRRRRSNYSRTSERRGKLNSWTNNSASNVTIEKDKSPVPPSVLGNPLYNGTKLPAHSDTSGEVAAHGDSSVVAENAADATKSNSQRLSHRAKRTASDPRKISANFIDSKNEAPSQARYKYIDNTLNGGEKGNIPSPAINSYLPRDVVEKQINNKDATNNNPSSVLAKKVDSSSINTPEELKSAIPPEMLDNDANTLSPRARRETGILKSDASSNVPASKKIQDVESGLKPRKRRIVSSNAKTKEAAGDPSLF